MTKVIIDTDPGVDDALALLMALCSNLDVIGITTVYGNSSIQNSTKNARFITSLLRSDISIYQGASRPLRGRSKRASSHGSNGLGDIRIPDTVQTAQMSAQEFLVKSLEQTDQPIDIVAIGPLTNIARLCRARPDLVKNIGQVIILGGVIDEPGNISPYSEFNAYNDPWALREVLSIIPRCVLIPIEVCRKVVFSEQTFQRLTNDSLQKSIAMISALYIDYYRTNEKFKRFDGGVMYDLLAIGYLIQPSLFRIERMTISVSTDKATYGKTEQSRDGNACQVVRQVDAKALEDQFINLMNGKI